MWKFLEPIWTVRDCGGTFLGVFFIIYEINCVLVCMRLEMAMEIGFKKWNKCWMSGLPTDSPLALFHSPSLCKMDHKSPCVLALKFLR